MGLSVLPATVSSTTTKVVAAALAEALVAAKTVAAVA
jgi:hypothetical protein